MARKSKNPHHLSFKSSPVWYVYVSTPNQIDMSLKKLLPCRNTPINCSLWRTLCLFLAITSYFPSSSIQAQTKPKCVHPNRLVESPLPSPHCIVWIVWFFWWSFHRQMCGESSNVTYPSASLGSLVTNLHTPLMSGNVSVICQIISAVSSVSSTPFMSSHVSVMHQIISSVASVRAQHPWWCLAMYL